MVQFRTSGEYRDPAVGIDRERQHKRFGGLNWGASFFGWLVAVGITALAAIAGGKIGERYHHKVDRVGLHRD
jgi:hypothetical protein